MGHTVPVTAVQFCHCNRKELCDNVQNKFFLSKNLRWIQVLYKFNIYTRYQYSFILSSLNYVNTNLKSALDDISSETNPILILKAIIKHIQGALQKVHGKRT